MWICEVSWHIFITIQKQMYYNIKLKTVHYPDSLQWLPIRYQIQAGHFMGTRNSCQLQQKYYYESIKKKELYYLKEKSSYLLVNLSLVFEKRLVHILPYFSWHCLSASVKILSISDNHYKSQTLSELNQNLPINCIKPICIIMKAPLHPHTGITHSP